MTLVERASEPKMASLCLIVIIFLTGSRLDLTRRPARIMTVILEVGRREDRSKQKVVPVPALPSDGDICRLVPIWIQI